MIRFMPQRDPLEELFRRSSEELEQRPGLKGWHRLEKRLDQGRSSVIIHSRRARHRTQGFFKPWLYAAAALVLVLIIVIGLGSQPGSGIDGSLLARQPESVEDFNLDAAQPARVADYQGISEGERGKVLTVRNSSIPRLMPAEKYRL